MRTSRCAAIVLAACLTAVTFAQVRTYEGYQVLRVQVPDEPTLERIAALGADLWSEHAVTGVLDVMVAPEQRAAFDALGLDYEVWIADVQQRIDEGCQPAGRGWFDAYHTYEEIVTYINQLAVAYPNLATVINLGDSLEGRPLWGLRIAGPSLSPLSPAVFYFGGAHAREWIGPTVPQYLATHLLANYGTNPAITDLVDHVEWFLVPVSNPDGYSFTWTNDRLWRKNRRGDGTTVFGVDINRNWSYQWGLDNGSSGSPTSGTYRGPYPFSEPETQALRDHMLAHPNIRAMNDLHSYSQYLLWPWGYTPTLPPDNAEYNVAGVAMKQLIFGVHGVNYTAGPTYTTIYAVSGGSVDWAYGERGIFAWSFELRDTGTYGFVLPPAQIIPNNQEVLPALLYLTNTPAVRATQINLLGQPPAKLVAGQDTVLNVAVTSGVELLDPNSPALHYRYDAGGPFRAAPLTHVAGAEYQARLPATNCGSTPQYYFSVTGASGVTTEPPDAPASYFTATMVSGTLILDEPLDTDPGWTTEGQWAFGKPLGLGGTHGKPDPKVGHTGQNVYGYNLGGDYANLIPEYALTTTPVDCSYQYGLRLSFWRWLGVERAPYDRARVKVSNNGADWVTLWENPTVETADGVYVYQEFDISAVADNQPTVYIRWTMGPTDSGWTYCGWNVDDVQIFATGCIGAPGDYDGDHVIGLGDIAGLAECLTGPALPVAPGCGVLDVTGDDIVDLGDLAALQAMFTGP